MPTSYTIEPSLQCVKVTLSGDTTYHEIISVLHAFTDDPSYSETFNILFDVRKITQYLSFAETQALFEHYNATMNNRVNGKIGVIITQPVQYGITRIASTIFGLNGIAVDAFYSEEEAMRWFRQ
jgi:hypothetical protein